METKICKKCGKEKPIDQFPLCFGKVSGTCKECCIETRRENKQFRDDVKEIAARLRRELRREL